MSTDKNNINSKAREWRHDSDKTQTNKPKWRTISPETLSKTVDVPKTHFWN